MTAIFLFSSQTGTESEEVSGFARQLIEMFLYKYFNNEDWVETLINSLETVIRKTAHLFIYFCLGFSVSATFTSYGTKKNIFLKAVLFCLLYAASDEIHQYFVDGRAAEFTDVLLDTAGAAAGILFRPFFIKKTATLRRTDKTA